MQFEGDTIEQVFHSYCQYIVDTQPPDFARNFINGWRRDPEPALAEAMVFAWARSFHLNPTVNEQHWRGGMDFRCVPDVGAPFLLEVTVIKTVTAERHCGLPNDPQIPGGWFRLITRNLNVQIKRKWRQLQRSEAIPRVVAIVCFIFCLVCFWGEKQRDRYYCRMWLLT
jgi:hypothetical protein